MALASVGTSHVTFLPSILPAAHAKGCLAPPSEGDTTTAASSPLGVRATPGSGDDDDTATSRGAAVVGGLTDCVRATSTEHSIVQLSHTEKLPEQQPRAQTFDAHSATSFYEHLQKLAAAHELALANARAETSHTHEGGPTTLQSSRVSSETFSVQGHPAVAVPQLPGCLDQSRHEPPARFVVAKAPCPSSRQSESSVGVGSKAFKLLRPWRSDAVHNPHRYSFSSWTRSKLDTPSLNQYQESKAVGNSCVQPLIVHPNSFKRLAWDLFSMLLLAYDIIMIPFLGIFDPPLVPFTAAMNYLTMFFWTLDIVASILTGYQDGREIVLSLKKIVKRYLKTWFWLDCVIVGLDWTVFFIGDSQGGGSAARLGRSLRTLRFIRTLRLVRLLKVKRILQDIEDQINTEALSICFRILKIILVLVLANHVVACAWYGIGTLDGYADGLSTWVIENQMGDRDLTYKYVTSLHWSLTQFTPASMEVVPQNVHERMFAVVVLLFAMITFSSFVSILTASMAELRNITSDEARQFWLLRRYLRDWSVSRRFALRLQRYLEYAYHKQRQRVQAKDVKLLALLSGQLHDELKAETFSVHLVTHPLFLNSSSGLRIFSKALSDMFLGRRDCVFSCGEQGRSMLFVCSGVFSYQLGELVAGDGTGPVHPTTPPSMVDEGQWVAEAALWSNWLHVGDLTAVTEGQAISIDATRFGEAVIVFRPSWMAFRMYAQHFVQALNEIEHSKLTDLVHDLLLPQEILDTSCFVKQQSWHTNDDTQDFNLKKLRRTVCRSLLAPCAWLYRRQEPVAEDPPEFLDELR